MMTEYTPIPGPVGIPILGNALEIDPGDSISSLNRLADTYGPFYKLTLGGNDRHFISSVELMNEVCDEKKYDKAVAGALKEVRAGIEDGLFTAYPGEHNWEVAHRVLMPAFGPLSIRGMFDEMHDIASQLVMKWARFGSKDTINVTDDFTRLTLDSIAICAMDTRFNSFYQPDLHPFVHAMVGLLVEAGERARRPAIQTYLMGAAERKRDENIAYMKEVAAEVLAERRAHPVDKKDLLNAMVLGRDPKTGEGLTDASIMNNMITFLIAGHETTSGMLSFLFYYLLKNPGAYQAAQKEVDDLVGRGPVTVEHMSKLPYLNACLRETLRLRPTAAAFSVTPKEDTVLGGKYFLKKGETIVANLSKIQRDPAVYGEDAEEFKPERMLDEPFSKLPPNSWKPFGNGMRGCIGRPFAWQEALLSVCLLLQNFNFRMHDPSYELSILQTLTIKPKGFFMHASLREGIDPVHLEKLLHIDTSQEGHVSDLDKKLAQPIHSGKPTKPMTILYGSNSGTCEALAQSLARSAAGYKFNADVRPLDSAVGSIPKDQPVLLISSSYEGQPPDNAAHFVEWLTSLKGDELKGAQYAVYGVGNHDWVSTFHKVPKGLDSSFAEHGAKRIAGTGLGNVAEGDIFNDFDKWQDEVFWPAVSGAPEDVSNETSVDIEIDTTTRTTRLRQDVREAVVISNEVLTAPGETEKRHIKLQLPSSMEYKVGDYLAVLPLNDAKNIRRILKRYGLPWDSMITIKSGANTTLPMNQPMSINDILGAYVELSQPATKKNVYKIASSIPDEATRKELENLAATKFDSEITFKRRSPLDILEEYPSATLALGDFLAMLPPMRIRQYSISSSPLSDPSTATLTWSVLDSPALSAAGKRYLGVASNYLSKVEAGDRVHVSVKPSHGNFRPPSDVEKTPLIMICAGTGIAPFRGFVQERAMQVAAGRKLAPAHLFIGCAHPEKDVLFKEELKEWEEQGVVKTYYAYSKAKDQSKGCKYVQDRLWEEREEMVKIFDAGGRVYVCGSAAVGDGIKDVVCRMYREVAEERGKDKTDAEVEEWFRGIKTDRYASDVFA